MFYARDLRRRDLHIQIQRTSFVAGSALLSNTSLQPIAALFPAGLSFSAYSSSSGQTSAGYVGPEETLETRLEMHGVWLCTCTLSLYDLSGQ